MKNALQTLLAYAFAVASAALACTYGFMSAVGPYAYIKAGILCLVAFGGVHGPALVKKAEAEGDLLGARIAKAGTVFCLLVTLAGGLGTLAGGSAELKGERSKVQQTAANDKAALDKARTDRAELGKVRQPKAVAADIEVAKALPAFRNSEGCKASEIEGNRARETCARFRALEGELATAQRAERLEEQIGALGYRLEHAPTVVDADPQAAALSRLTGGLVGVELSAALYALAASLALELMGMAVMMRAWSDRRKPLAISLATPPAAELETGKRPALASDELRRSNLVALAPSKQRRLGPLARAKAPAQTVIAPGVFGSVGNFMLTNLEPAPGERVQVRAVFQRYVEWCKAERMPAAELEKFADELERACGKAGLEIEAEDGGTVYCAGARFVA